MLRNIFVALFTVMLAGTGLHAGPNVPLRFTLEGNILSMVVEPPIASVDFVGSGNGTHLGSFDAVFPHQVNLETLYEEGDLTLVAPDGSSLTIHLTGPSLPTDQPFLLDVSVSGPVIAGTGRFEGVSGFVTGTGQVNLATGVVRGTFEGTLDKGKK